MRLRRLALLPLVALTMSSYATIASAQNMMAKFIRIDPEPTTDEKLGTPVIPMLVELGTPTPINSFAEGCFASTGSKISQNGLTCMSNKIQKEGYVKQYEFPTENAVVMSIVGDESKPMKVMDAIPFKEAAAPNAGVAWLILIDASSSVGTRWPEMQETAIALINSMGPNDAVQVRVMDDVSVKARTKWISSGAKGKAVNTVKGVGAAFKGSASVDSLISRIEKETVGGFQALFKDGVEGAEEGIIPLVQSVVILSDGGDTSAAGFAGGTKAQVIHEKLVKGDLGIAEGMRLPIPVVSIWFPENQWAGTLAATRRENEYQWMSNMATPEVGGYFDIVQDGETGKGARIAKVVRARFDNMYYVEVKASCLSTTGEQKFKLVFQDTKSKILPDTWSNVPIAFNFTKWLLAIDKKKTEETASKNPLKPGENFKVFGEFCWGSNTGAAEAYFVTEADAAEVKKASADKTGEEAKKLLQSLSAKGQKAQTVSASHTEAEFKVPNTPSLFENKAESFSLNVVILDNKALRVSARDKTGLLVLRAQKAPINKFLIIGAVGGGVVLILLIAILARGGGGNGRAKRRKGGAPPAPGPMPGQPPSPAPVAPAMPSPAMSPAAAPATAFAPPPEIGGTAFAPPAPMPFQQLAATAFAPPQQQPYAPSQPYVPAATAYAPPQQQQPPPQHAAPQPYAPATAFAPPAPHAQQPSYPQQQPAYSQQPSYGQIPGQQNPGSFEGGVPHPTYTPSQPQASAAPKGRSLKELNKGGTSFPTICPNPACQKSVLVPPGGTAQCAFCGTMVDEYGAAVAAIPKTSNFGLTGAATESSVAKAVADARAQVRPATAVLEPQQGTPANVRSVVLEGQAGSFRVLPGIESRAGRDGSLCSIALNEPRVSGVHASLKLEGGALFVRDDRSHNGTFVNGNRIAPGTWIPVPGGSQLRFGPIEFVVRHES